MTDPDQLPLFNAYPLTPGYQVTDTSKSAAETVKPKAAWVRARVIDCLTRQGPMTTVQIAKAISMAYETVQPRLSESRALGQVIDTGQRGPSRDPSKTAIVWAVATGTVAAAGEGGA